MKICNMCGKENEDSSLFCINCGNSLENSTNISPVVNAENNFNQTGDQTYKTNYENKSDTYHDPFDHTSEFSKKDISDNKVFAMLPYLFSVLGVIIALIASKDSDFVKFHVRQALKIYVCEVLLLIIAVLLCWTLIVPFAAGICILILAVISIIMFFYVCYGKAKEAPIVRSFGFLK